MIVKLDSSILIMNRLYPNVIKVELVVMENNAKDRREYENVTNCDFTLTFV